MKEAGIWDATAPIGIPGLLQDGWYPPSVTNVDQIPKDNPCKGALSVEHSHFFTADGLFGSLDENGNQVDDGTYQLIDDHTFFFPGADMKIHYNIEGNTVRFRVLIPNPCSKKCRESLPYAIGVFYPGVYHRTA